VHLVFAVWKSNRPFDKQHYPWEETIDTSVSIPSLAQPATAMPAINNEKAAGHKRAMPAKQVVTTADSSLAPVPAPVNPSPSQTAPARPRVDYAFLPRQVTLEQVLRHLTLLDQLHGSGQQRRGPCPIHGHATDRQHTFSVHLGKNVFQCFKADCAVQGNVLDFWAALHRLPLYEAALNLAATFHLPRNREDATMKVKGCRA
jgi:CHC2 zinc finger